MADQPISTPTGDDPFSRATAWYAGLDAGRQNQLWLGVLATLAIGGGAYWWMTNEPYQVVASGSQEQVGEASAALSAAGIPMRWDGINLSVPVSQVGEAMGAISAENLDHTVEDANRFPLGGGKAVIEWGMLRQKEGDLARTIAGMSGITAANVHIVPGKETLFGLTDPAPATASVLLDLAPSAKVSDQTVQAIANVVAMAVERLSPDRVAIADNRGNILRHGTGVDADRAAQGAIAAEQVRQSEEIKQKIREAIRGYVPHDTPLLVSALVNVDRATLQRSGRDLDLDKVVEKQVTSEDKSREKTAPEGGVPGVDGSLPERNAAAAPVGGGTNKEESSRSTVVTDYPTTNTVTTIPAGARLSASVAIALDSKALATVWGVEVDSDEYKAKVAKVTELAKTAMSFTEGKDALVVEASLPFAPPPPMEVAPTVTVTGVMATAAPWVPYAIATLALILGFLFVVRPLMARALTPVPKTGALAAVGPDGKPTPSPEAIESDKLRERIIGSVENFQPIDSLDFNRYVMSEREAAAAVLDDWLKKREG